MKCEICNEKLIPSKHMKNAFHCPIKIERNGFEYSKFMCNNLIQIIFNLNIFYLDDNYDNYDYYHHFARSDSQYIGDNYKIFFFEKYNFVFQKKLSWRRYCIYWKL